MKCHSMFYRECIDDKGMASAHDLGLAPIANFATQPAPFASSSALLHTPLPKIGGIFPAAMLPVVIYQDQTESCLRCSFTRHTEFRQRQRGGL